MTNLLPVFEAQRRICTAMPVVDVEQVQLADAYGRILAKNEAARRTQPPHAVSAMDGYAVIAEDIKTLPKSLSVIGEVPTGQKYIGSLSSGQAIRLFTGSRVPDGADTIVIQENTERTGDIVRVVCGEAPSGKFIRKAGLDFSEGDVLLNAPKKLSARDIGLAASMNLPWLTVRQKPRISLLATGDEIVMPGNPIGENQIVSSNVLALQSLIRCHGGQPIDLGIAPDNEKQFYEIAKNALRTDVLVTTGGASVGNYDLVQKVLRKMGLELNFWQIAMRPGKPLMFGNIGKTMIIGLPGNPVSSFVCAKIFLAPAIEAMQGLKKFTVNTRKAQLGCYLNENDEREDYLRAVTSVSENGTLIATPFPKQDSSAFSDLAKSDCLIIRPPFAAEAKKGETVDIFWLG